MKIPRRDHQEDFSLHLSFLSLVIDLLLAGEQWLGHFHHVVSALDDSLLIFPWLSFFTHQLRRCLMSLQVQHVLHPPVILTSAPASLSLSLWHIIYTLSSCPLLSLTRLELRAEQPLPSFPLWHLSFILFLRFTWNVSLCLVLSKSLTATWFQWYMKYT